MKSVHTSDFVKLDHCNGRRSGLPQKQIKRLQAVQNAAAKTVMKGKEQQRQQQQHTKHQQQNPDHNTPILGQLHWLPVEERTSHKIISATYRSVHNNTRLYLSDLLHRHTPSRLLRSAFRSLLDVPRPKDSKTRRYDRRAFRCVALFL